MPGLSQLAGQIQNLGESRFPNVFAGVAIVSGRLNVYLVPGRDSGFLAAVSALDTARTPYQLVKVKTNYATQAAASQWMASERSTLAKDGIVADWWGPDPVDNAVLAALQMPTVKQMTALGAAIARIRSARVPGVPIPQSAAGAVSVSSYRSMAAAFLNAESPYRVEIRVLPRLLRPMQPATASVAVYELPGRGRALEPVLIALGRWGSREPGGGAALPIAVPRLS